MHAINTKEGEIKPAKFEITFSPLGTIDDTFASFVANHENVSISNTSNNIKEYCRAVKEEIVSARGKFTIPNLGFLTMQNGKITFVQTDELDMGAAALPLPPIDTNLKKMPITNSISHTRQPIKPIKEKRYQLANL